MPKKTLQILSVGSEEIPYKDKKGADKKFLKRTCQCILHTGEGVKVCTYDLGKDMPDVKPGFYSPEFDCEVGFDNKLYAAIIALSPASAVSMSPSAAGVKAAA